MLELTTVRRFEDLSDAELAAFLQRGRSLRARAAWEQARRLWSRLVPRRAARRHAWRPG